jgi:tetratricopeptide (TPR) repeat protein
MSPDSQTSKNLEIQPVFMAGSGEKTVESKACTWMEEGQRCAEAGKHDKAIELFDRAIKENPDAADAWLAKCNELKALGRYPEALECYSTALRIDPKSCQAWIAKGNTLVKVGRQDEALECFGAARKVGTRRR